MTRTLSFFLLVAVISCVWMTTASAQAPDSVLAELFEDDWTAREDNRDAIKLFGDDKPEKRPFRDVSPAATVRRQARDVVMLDRLHDIAFDSLSQKSKLNYRLFEFDLSDRISDADRKAWRIPFLSDNGFHTSLAGSIEETSMKDVDEIEEYIRKLEAIPGYLDQQISNMRVGLADGYTQPRAIMAKIAPGFEALTAASAEESIFYAPFRRLPESLSEDEQLVFQIRGQNILKTQVLPALSALHEFIKDEYTPQARESLGASDLPDGAQYYQSLISYYTTLDLTAEEIHAIGLEEVLRIRSEMEEIIYEVEFEGSFEDFLLFLRTDPQFYVENAEELMMHAAWIAKRIDEKMPAFFRDLPRMSYGVRAVPDEIAPNYTTGRYWAPIKNVRGGLFMVNTYNLPERPLYNLPALALHEGVPGHHHQIALAAEMTGVPEFRKSLYLSVFGEGWGLYSERLGLEMGIYRTPYERFGRLTYEMWRAGRLVVDTGIHAMGWSREQAVDFFLKNTALAEHNINTEVDRYISWPAQALSYKMGELKIVELRRRAEDLLGDDFDIRDFHRAILHNGTVPLEIMDDQINEYINGVRAAGDAKE